MAPLEYPFMAGKAQEVQVGDINIGQGWETLVETARGKWSQRWRAPPFKHM